MTNMNKNNIKYLVTGAAGFLGYRTRSYRETMHDEIQWLIQTGKVKTPAAKETAMNPVPAHA